MKKINIALIIVASLLVALVVVVLFGVSPFAKYYIEKHGKELVGRRMTMDKVRINLLNGKLAVDNFVMYEPDDTATFVSFERFAVDVRLMSLLNKRVKVHYVILDAPDVRVIQQGDDFNFDDITAHFKSDSISGDEPVDSVNAKRSADKRPWRVEIDSISVNSGVALYQDRLIGATWGFNDLNIYIPGIHFSGEDTDVGLVLSFAGGGRMNNTLAYNIENEDFDLNVKLEDFAMSGLLPYFKQAMNVSSIDGKLSADVHIKGNMQHILAFGVEGSADVSSFLLMDNKQRRVAALDSGRAELLSANLLNNDFRFGRVALSGLQSELEIYADSTNNFSDLMRHDDAKTADVNDANITVERDSVAGKPLSIAFAEIDVNGSAFVFRDNTLCRPFEYRVSDISLKSKNFNPDAPNNNVQVTATLQNTGTATLKWTGSLADMVNQNIKVSLANVAMRDFSAYCETYTAHPITTGNLTFVSQNVIKNSYLDGTNHLDTYELAVDKKSGEIKPVVKVPLKLGVYVLTDKKGHINLDLPVKGRVDSPEFSYKRIVLKALGNVLLKVTTAPFGFLSGKGSGLTAIAITNSTLPTFNAEQYARFDEIAATLKDKPEMKITLRQQVNYGKLKSAVALTNLKAAYYKAYGIKDSTAMLDMLDYDKIVAMDAKSDGLAHYADSLLAARGMSGAGNRIEQKAMALYKDDAAVQSERIMHTRDSLLADYMKTKQQLSDEQFAIWVIPVDSLVGFVGKDRYAIILDVAGESVDVTAAADEEAAAATAVSDDDSADSADAGLGEIRADSTLMIRATTSAATESTAATKLDSASKTDVISKIDTVSAVKISADTTAVINR